MKTNQLKIMFCLSLAGWALVATAAEEVRSPHTVAWLAVPKLLTQWCPLITLALLSKGYLPPKVALSLLECSQKTSVIDAISGTWVYLRSVVEGCPSSSMWLNCLRRKSQTLPIFSKTEVSVVDAVALSWMRVAVQGRERGQVCV